MNGILIFRLVLLEKTTLGTVHTGVNRVETINARDAVFIAVNHDHKRKICLHMRFSIVVIEISCRSRFITFNSSLFRCIKSKLEFNYSFMKGCILSGHSFQFLC